MRHAYMFLAAVAILGLAGCAEKAAPYVRPDIPEFAGLKRQDLGFVNYVWPGKDAKHSWVSASNGILGTRDEIVIAATAEEAKALLGKEAYLLRTNVPNENPRICTKPRAKDSYQAGESAICFTVVPYFKNEEKDVKQQ